VFLRTFRLSVLLACGASPALGATHIRTTLDDTAAVAALGAEERAPRRIRGSLDDDPAGVPSTLEPRRIRSSLDDVAPSSRASFPLDDGVPLSSTVRLIRLTLEDGRGVYGFLGTRAEPPRRLRLTLD
jgi:hypothetical protein